MFNYYLFDFIKHVSVPRNPQGLVVNSLVLSVTGQFDFIFAVDTEYSDLSAIMLNFTQFHIFARGSVAQSSCSKW